MNLQLFFSYDFFQRLWYSIFITMMTILNKIIIEELIKHKYLKNVVFLPNKYQEVNTVSKR